MPPQRCNRLIASYCKRLIAVVGWPNQLLGLGGKHFFTQGHVGLDFVLIHNKNFIQKLHAVFTCVIFY